MQVEIETVASIIHHARKAGDDHQVHGGGALHALCGAHLSPGTPSGPRTWSPWGAFSPQEVEEDVEISLAAIEHRFPDLEKRSSPNQNQAAFG